MQRILAVSLAIIIILFALVPQGRHWVASSLAHLSNPASRATSTPSIVPDLPIPSIQPVVLTNIYATPVGVEAWKTFDAYRTAAEKHDIKTLASLSYQLSPQCQAALARPSDASSTAPCYQLMDSAAFFSAAFKESDFTHVAYDDNQVVLATDYVSVEGASEPIKAVLYFIRDAGSMKVLGIRFCLGKEKTANECVNTDSATRDTNKNGWWDDVEVLFRK